ALPAVAAPAGPLAARPPLPEKVRRLRHRPAHDVGSVPRLTAVPRHERGGTDRLAAAGVGPRPGPREPPLPRDGAAGPEPRGGAGGGAGAVVAAARRRAGGVELLPQPAGLAPGTGGVAGRGAGPAARRLPRGDHPAEPGGAAARGGGAAHAAQPGRRA